MSDHKNLKYVHVDSKNRHYGDSKTRFNVSIPSFNHCTRVCLKDFSIANTFGNTDKIKINWIEIRNFGTVLLPKWKSAIFTAEINTENESTYRDNKQLQVKIHHIF